MTLETQLSRKPYFDDFDETAQFYRILYKPGVALQTRELNQTQSIFQDQISKFGRSIYKEGSVIEGCTFSFDNKLSYVKLADNLTNLSVYNPTNYEGSYVYNADYSLKALIVGSANGYISQAPNTNTFYVKYQNSTQYQNGIPKTTFDPGETLIIRNVSNTLTLATLTAAVNTGSFAAVGNVTGFGFSMSTTSGVIFKKGTFLYVTPQTIIVDRYSNIPDQLSVGFEAPESIQTAQTNTALNDNAAGSPNYSAPGADRLKIAPTLTVRTTNEANTASFFTIADFKLGAAVTLRQTPQYSVLGAELARRSFETNGNFVVSPFTVSVASKNTPVDAQYIQNGIVTHNNLLVSKGLAYVEGYRVEYINTNYVDIRKSTDTANSFNQIVTANFGSFFQVQELAGEFGESSSIIKVELHNVAKTAISSNIRLGVGVSSGTKIGTAFVKGLKYSGGTPGLADCLYNLYLFNITPTANPANVRSIVYKNNSGTVLGVCDVKTSKNFQGNDTAQLYDTKNNRMIFGFGNRAIKPDSFTNGSFIYRKKQSPNPQFGIDGLLSITLPSANPASEIFPYGDNIFLSDSEIKDFHIVAAQYGYTYAKTGTVTTSTSTTAVTGDINTRFTSEYRVGDYISVNTTGSTYEDRLITAILGDHSITVNQPFANAGGSHIHRKSFPIGAPLSFTGLGLRTIEITNGSRTATFDLGVTDPNPSDVTDLPVSAFQVELFYNVLRTNIGSGSKKKTLNKGTLVKITAASNPGGVYGPWCLGIPDAVAIEAVYISSDDYVTSGVNYASSFTLDNGQQDTHYDLSYLKVIPGSSASNAIKSNSKITVQLTHYTYSDSNGKGYFLADSYPVDDVNGPTDSLITIEDIPTFTAKNGSYFDLRDCADFRPIADTTATITKNIVYATLDPIFTVTFASTTPYLPVPDSNLQISLQYYQARIDRVSIDTNGSIVIEEGKPDIVNPIAPLEKSGTMSLGIINVPPYPSLATNVARTKNRYDYAMTSKLSQIRRYTMKDITSLDNRIKNIEYYTSLSLLEQRASTLLVKSSSTGQNRFQNGIFVDPFAGFDIANTKYPGFFAQIENNKLTPGHTSLNASMAFDSTRSGPDVVKHGELIMLNHNKFVSYISQKYANKSRLVAGGSLYHYNGTLKLDPPGTISPDITKGVDVIQDLDMQSNWVDLAAGGWGTRYNDYVNVGDATVTDTLFGASSTLPPVTNADGSTDTTTKSQTIKQKSQKQQATGTKLVVNPTADKNLPLFTGVNSIGILPFLKAATVKFETHGMKPTTKVYPYFGNVDVLSQCHQSDSTYTTNLAAGNLTTDANGSIYGWFYIPEGIFKAQDNDFMLTDISNLNQGLDTAQTMARVTFFGSNLTYAQGSSALNIRGASVSFTDATPLDRTVTGLSVENLKDQVEHTDPPPPPGSGHSCGCGGSIICTKLYELGLMDKDTYEADQMFGEYLRQSENADIYWGYIRWAGIVVNWMSGNTPNVMFWIRDPEKRRQRELELTLKITHRIATPWAEHMQFLMGRRETDNKVGKLIMSVGVPVSKLINKLPKFNNTNPGWFTKCSMIGLFVILYNISKIFGGKFGFPKPINI
jgi:hypothetical protein